MVNNIENKIELLKEYFLKRPDISMAFIFGSYAKGSQISESDIDIAVYFIPNDKAVEWEEEKYYPAEDQIWADVEKIAGINTDFLVLNRVSSTVAFSAVSEGIPIIIKDHSVYLRFLLTISSAAEYLWDMSKDFWAIKQRSMSLTESDRQRLTNCVDFLGSEIKYYPDFINLKRQDYESVIVTRRNVERWIENIVNASIDIAKIILASEKKRIPQTYRDIFQELVSIEGFPETTALNIGKFAKLRNILAHEYLDIRFRHIKEFLDESGPLYNEFFNFAEEFLEKK